MGRGGGIMGYGHAKVKRSPPPRNSWLALSLRHHLTQQMAVTLHFNKFSPWQGLANSIIHLLNDSFHIITRHNTHPRRRGSSGRARWRFFFV